MKLVLPIAVLLAILTVAAVFGGANRAPGAPVPTSLPADLPGASAPAAASVTPREAVYPVAVDPYVGWAVADLQHGVADPGPDVAAPFPPQPMRIAGNPWGGPLVTLADVRALYEAALPALDADPVPAAAPATGAWETVPLDAK